MATKFALKPNPIFKKNVTIPRAGQEPGIVTFSFRHKALEELSDLEKQEGITGKMLVMEIVEAWALPDEFNQENLSLLFSNYPQAQKAVIEAYYEEMLGAREKN
ncbi:phage tail assembly chaperone [Edaphovirga cremea]|uniref:phage tail assembly chaperone n=1 Tax=Edaphovirga cremea TaxID=2267246 RepID=UPI003988EFA8